MASQGGGSSNSGATGNRRPTKACSRCRKRKIKCDFQFPTCGNCALAKTQCMGYDVVRGQETPRSTISHLENQIAQLEITLAAARAHETRNLAEVARTAVQKLSTRLARTIAEPRGLSTSTASPFFLPLRSTTFLSQSPLPRFASEQALAGGDDAYREVLRSTNISSIPRHVVDIMIKNYCEIYLPQYPAIEEGELYLSCEKIYIDESPSHFDFFTVAITLAISANTLIRHDEKRAMAAAGEFWATAVEHLEHVGEANVWQRLQALQLLAHYGLLNPRLVNCSNCASAATRLCLQLGLHRELPPTEQEKLDARLLNTRRRLFWTSYCLDAALHSVLCRPYVWPGTAISARFPASTSLHESSPAERIFPIRQLEAEITIKMYYPSLHQSTPTSLSSSPTIDEERPSQSSFESWFASTNSQLLSYGKGEKSGLADVISLLIFRLNRPSPRIPTPSLRMRYTAIATAISLTADYTHMAHSGKFFYIWYAAHYLTELGASLLESIISGLLLPSSSSHLNNFDVTVIKNTIKTFPLLLRKVASRWPEIQQQAQAMEEVALPVLKGLECWERGVRVQPVSFGPVKEKLAQFLLATSRNPLDIPPESQAFQTQAAGGPRAHAPTSTSTEASSSDTSKSLLNTGATITASSTSSAALFSPTSNLHAAALPSSLPFPAPVYMTDPMGPIPGPEVDYDFLWDMGLAGLDLDQVFAALMEGSGDCGAASGAGGVGVDEVACGGMDVDPDGSLSIGDTSAISRAAMRAAMDHAGDDVLMDG